jgi:hypothetical protein
VDNLPYSPKRSRRQEIHRLAMALRHIPIAKDILLYSQEEFEYWKDSINHVVGRAVREGKVLHERP